MGAVRPEAIRVSAILAIVYLIILGPFAGCVADCGEQSGGVVVVESGDGVAEVDRDAACEAG